MREADAEAIAVEMQRNHEARCPGEEGDLRHEQGDVDEVEGRRGGHAAAHLVLEAQNRDDKRRARDAGALA